MMINQCLRQYTNRQIVSLVWTDRRRTKPSTMNKLIRHDDETVRCKQEENKKVIEHRWVSRWNRISIHWICYICFSFTIVQLAENERDFSLVISLFRSNNQCWERISCPQIQIIFTVRCLNDSFKRIGKCLSEWFVIAITPINNVNTVQLQSLIFFCSSL